MTTVELRIIPPSTIARWKAEQRLEAAFHAIGRLAWWGVLIGVVTAIALALEGGAA